ncbi:serine/arginine repetitive matrix protein 1 isoform X2 [Drosophila biarmipes]|uniref:serine/arginine repetitive matrix protein 1 isoform X2 n=1 Tax=Drosophila biarmipes TaxID=125945 RepID=UPI0021CC5279|nr:serine/arginine repetitive matrix protein 1 isoform X2 [Drosophila biarmipes]
MDIFDMVKAAPPPQAITPIERKISTPSPVPPDSPYNSDILESGNLSNDEELDKEPALDKSTFKLASQKSDVIDQKSEISPFKMPKPIKTQGEDIVALKGSSDEEQAEPSFRKPRKSGESNKTSSNKKSAAAAQSYPLKPHKKRPAETLPDDEDSEEDQQLTTMPTKTKAQQKMFSDQPPGKSNCDRQCVVRVRRLTQQEINSAFKSVANSPFAHVADSSRSRPDGRKGRGRPRKSNPSPPKKQKSPTQSNFHIKVPLQNGAKKRALNQLTRPHTPPPNLTRKGAAKAQSKSPEKPKSKSPSKPIRGRHASQALIQRFGARFFGCVVKIKRTPWPDQWPQCSPRPIGGARKGRPRKSNLSVSFSEAVEILGSPEGPSRRATFGSYSSRSTPKPTRLQRVDATGNVLEDIALTSTPLFSPSAGPSTSGGSRSKGKRRSCNGSPMGPRLKRPHQRLPLSSLASLRLDDSPNSGEDEEYIVPNELPGIKRTGTPPLKKKKISFTTTISDDEDEKPTPKKLKDNLKKQPKPHKETGNKKTDKAHKEKSKADKSHKGKEKKQEKQEKTNEIPKEKLTPATEAVEAAEKPEVKQPEEETPSEERENKDEEAVPNEIERDGDAQEKSVDAAEENPDESVEEKADEKLEEKLQDKLEDKLEEKLEDKLEEKIEEKAQEENPQEDTEKELGEAAEETSEIVHESSEKPTGEENIEVELEQAEEFRDLPTPPLLPSTVEEHQDDILEIQTSLDDVRQLHTPSSRLSTPKPRSRLDSGESDCSFKSASDHDKQQPAGLAAGDVIQEAEKPADAAEVQLAEAMTDDTLDPAELPAELMTPPTAPRTANGSDLTSGSSASAPFYSPIDSMPTLDDEVLGQLVDYK